MNKYLNFTSEHGLSINAHRAPGTRGVDLVDLVDAVIKGTGSVSCLLGGAEDYVCDGSLWGWDVIKKIHGEELTGGNHVSD